MDQRPNGANQSSTIPAAPPNRQPPRQPAQALNEVHPRNLAIMRTALWNGGGSEFKRRGAKLMQFNDAMIIGALAPGANGPPALWWWAFAILGALGAIWTVLIAWLFRRLRNRHAATYEEIGAPSLIWNNSLRSNWLFLKFLYSPRRLELDDEPASRVIDILRVLAPVYCVGFLIFMVLTLIVMFV